MHECNLNLGLSLEDIYEITHKEFISIVYKRANRLRLLGAELEADKDIIFYKDSIEYNMCNTAGHIINLASMSRVPSSQTGVMRIHSDDNGYPKGTTIHVPNMVSAVLISLCRKDLERLKSKQSHVCLNIHIHGKARYVGIYANNSPDDMNCIDINVICNGSNVRADSINITGIENGKSLKHNKIRLVPCNVNTLNYRYGDIQYILSDYSVPVEQEKEVMFNVYRTDSGDIADEIERLLSENRLDARNINSIDDIEFIRVGAYSSNNRAYLKIIAHNEVYGDDEYNVKASNYRKILSVCRDRSIQHISIIAKVWDSNGEVS